MEITKDFLNSLGLEGGKMDAILNRMNEVELSPFEKHLKTKFSKTGDSSSKWIPVFILMEFVKDDFKENRLFTSNYLGRSLKKIGVSSSNRYYKNIGRTCVGYNLSILDNSDHVNIMNLKNNYNE